MKLTVIKTGNMVDIFTDGSEGDDDFNYGNIERMYATGPGIGLQCNNESKRKALLEMCGKIAEAVRGFE